MSKSKSNTMVPLTGTVVIRDGKRVRPQIGKPYDFEGDEIEQLEASGAKFRAPTDESESADAESARTSTGKAKPSAEASQSKARGGKKPATANESDEEAAEDADLDL